MKPTDGQIDRMLSAQIPGGSAARDWFLPHDTAQGLANVRDVVRCMLAAAKPAPIDMILLCPKCGTQHIDRDESNNRMHSPGCNVSCGTLGGCSCGFDSLWRNPPHRSHLCHVCRHIWRPADVPTNGVAAIKTKGKNDSWAKQ